MMPEIWIVTHRIGVWEIRSASRKVRCARIIVRAISVCSSLLIVLITYENHTQIPTPKIIPPMIISTNVISPQSPEESVSGLFMTSRRTRNRANAVPSLNKLSPSSIKRSLLGSHISLAIESIATGSVEEIITQNSNMISIGRSIPIKRSNRCPHRAIIDVERRSPTVASDRIGR